MADKTFVRYSGAGTYYASDEVFGTSIAARAGDVVEVSLTCCAALIAAAPTDWVESIPNENTERRSSERRGSGYRPETMPPPSRRGYFYDDL